MCKFFMWNCRRATSNNDDLYCDTWQKEMCASLGLTLIRGNHLHVQHPVMYNVSHHPASTTRIAADGNCFFRSMSLVVTGSQDFHHEMRLLITTHMIHASKNLISSDESVEQYMKRTRMQSLGVWASEVEIIAAASLLNSTIYVYALCGDSNKWLRYSADKATCNSGFHQDECIYITNLHQHFETVKHM